MSCRVVCCGTLCVLWHFVCVVALCVCCGSLIITLKCKKAEYAKIYKYYSYEAACYIITGVISGVNMTICGVVYYGSLIRI